MANRIPVVVDASLLRFSEIPENDNLDLAGCGIVNAGNITSNTTINSTAVNSNNVYSYGTITSATTINATTSITGDTLSGTTSITSSNIYAGGTINATSSITGDSITSSNIYAGGNINATDTITAGTVNPTAYHETFSNVLISSGTVTYDLTTASIFRTDLSNDIITVNFTNPPAANTGIAFIITIVGTGQNNTITWPSTVKYKDNTAPSINGNVGNVNSFVFLHL